MTFYSNVAAVLFEQKKFDECIEKCLKAVEVGRENRADYTLIAKAFARIGNAYIKKDDLKEALHFIGKSLSEHRDPELVKKQKQLEKDLKERERLAYINPELAEQEKVKGNEFFKKGDYPQAMKHYNEAVKRNPDNAVLYSNRAACFTKLMEFSRAIEDCNTAIKLDPKFIKAYIRKGAALSATHDYAQAQQAYEEALRIDPNNQEALGGVRHCYQNNDESAEKTRARAMQDPEVQEILRDPSMRMMLEQMNQDPGAVREHLQNPDVMKKLMKLRKAGIIEMR
uniref:Stress-induced-phosphoprotein 1 n=1 Tax=Steinernema glaseri TaxID=37863 RepID=A0A1I7ZHJ6_9BILA